MASCAVIAPGLIVAAAAWTGAAVAQISCVGDCDGNNHVVVNELVVGVRIALAATTVDDCLADDPNLDRDVAVNELVSAVRNLLDGCPGGPTPSVSGTAGTPGTPTATGSATPTGPTATPTAASTATATFDDGTPRTPTVTPTFFVNTPPGTPDEKLPRLVGAASASNTTIIVQFSKPMSDTVKKPGNYVLTQEHVNPEAGRLTVTAAEFLDGDPFAVKLTTLSQNEVVYRLRVLNVKDTLGSPLAPIQVVGGVIIDSSSTTFPGTPPGCGAHKCTNGSDGMSGMAGMVGMALCTTDADCPCPADAPDTCTSAGACAEQCEVSDSDDDGLPDNVEQLGWVVTVHRTNGTTTQREVTGDPGLQDTDRDGLADKTELQIATDPRRADTDGDGLGDYEEYNVIYSDPTSQDTDGDGNDDKLEVEFFKTNALLADSDGDGFDDGEELYQINRDPRIADLPEPDFSIGEVRLQINELFTYTDENGETHTEDSNTATSLVTGRESSHATTTDILAGFNFQGGISPCAGSEGQPCKAIGSAPLVLATVFFQHETQTTDASVVASQQAFESSLEKAQSFSSDSTVTRQIVGARVDVAVTFTNRSDVAVTLSNLQITALTTDPQDSAKFIPLGTLLPDSQQQSGAAAAFNIGPGESRGPILFSNTQVFPNLVEELMKAPHGLIFKMANYDLTTGDGRNFAFGLQAVRERTVNVSVDFGDGTVKQANAITAPVLDRPRDEMRCAPGGDHPQYACASDADCGASLPCAGGKVIGGLSNYGGTGTPSGIPLDFVLRDVMHLRKTTPPVIFAGADGTVQTTARGDDVQLANVGMSGLGPYALVVSPGHNGVLDTSPAGDDVGSQGAAIVAGPDGIADTVAAPDDLQVVPPGTRDLPSDAIVVAAAGNRVLATTPSGDDVLTGPDGILAGGDGIVQSVAEGDDVQLVPVGTTGVADDSVVIAAGQNGVLDTHRQRDDRSDVVTGYEVSRTCNYQTPSAIVAGANGTADTVAAAGTCTTAYPPHFPGESGCSTDADCGSDPDRAGVFGVCSSDLQVLPFGAQGLPPFAAVVLPKDSQGNPLLGSYVRSVPPVSSDDVFVGPGIPCITDVDCLVLIPPIGPPPFTFPIGPIAGRCTGSETVVRVDNRRNGQFRRFWAVLTNKTDIVQTDFSRILVRPGNAINLSFIQDADRDGLIAQEEFLHATSDFNRDTDGDMLDDFPEIRLGWTVGAVGQALRRVFPDPRNTDSDGDGLTDLEESDLRRDQCACDAIGPKTLLGSGNLLRGQPGSEVGGRPCTSDAMCDGGICRDTVHCTYANYLLGNPCPACDTDQTLHRTDPRLRDTDADRVGDFDEVFGYRTGSGIFSPPLVGGPVTGFVPQVVVTANSVAHTRACPMNHCQEDAGVWCQTDGDCLSHQCIHPEACDDVQVVAPGDGGLAPNTVVVAPGPNSTYQGRLSPTEGSGDIVITTAGTHGQGVAIDNNASQAKALESARPTDQQIVPKSQRVFDEATLQCADGSAFAARATGYGGLPLRFAMCGVIKPGPDGTIETTAENARGAAATSTLHNVLVPGDSGQKVEVTDPLNPDTDGDEIADGFERVLGSSPNDPTDTGLSADTDEDGVSDNIEKSGWSVSITGPHPAMRMVASNPYVQDTDADGLPDYAEAYMPCRANLAQLCPTDPTTGDTDGDGLSDYDELSAAQVARLEALNGFFAGYHFDASRSEEYGTDANNSDTDGDGLTDGDEVLAAFYLSVPGESAVRSVFTNPLDDDTDHDGLTDMEEEQMFTDPTDPDTDADKRLDGREHDLGTDPLVRDVHVTVTFNEFRITDGPDAANFNVQAWRWFFYVQKPTDFFPGEAVATTEESAKFVGSCIGGPNAGKSCSTLADCPGGSQCNGKQVCFGFPGADYTPDCGGANGLNICHLPNRTDVYLGDRAQVEFTLHAGQGFVVNGVINNYLTCATKTLYCDPMRFFEAYTYESVTGFQAKTETLSGAKGGGGGTCGAEVTYEITTD
jgi:hypothetical protein